MDWRFLQRVMFAVTDTDRVSEVPPLVAPVTVIKLLKDACVEQLKLTQEGWQPQVPRIWPWRSFRTP